MRRLSGADVLGCSATGPALGRQRGRQEEPHTLSQKLASQQIHHGDHTPRQERRRGDATAIHLASNPIMINVCAKMKRNSISCGNGSCRTRSAAQTILCTEEVRRARGSSDQGHTAAARWQRQLGQISAIRKLRRSDLSSVSAKTTSMDRLQFYRAEPISLWSQIRGKRRAVSGATNRRNRWVRSFARVSSICAGLQSHHRTAVALDDFARSPREQSVPVRAY